MKGCLAASRPAFTVGGCGKNSIHVGYFVHYMIIQVTMLRAKFGIIKIRANLLQGFDNNFDHFNNRFCRKVDKTSYDFSREIADCCSIPLATLLIKIVKLAQNFFKNYS